MRTVDLRPPQPVLTRARGVRVTGRFSPRRLNRRWLYVTRAQALNASLSLEPGAPEVFVVPNEAPGSSFGEMIRQRLTSARIRLRGGSPTFLWQGDDDLVLVDAGGRELDWKWSEWRARQRWATITPQELLTQATSSRVARATRRLNGLHGLLLRG